VSPIAIAIIPARSGSKSIKHKNIKIFKKKPLIYWSTKSCIDSKIINKIYVSTDSKKYAKIALKHGTHEIIMRPKSISSDKSTDLEMIEYAIKNIKINFDVIAHIRPTSPDRKKGLIDSVTKKFLKSNAESLRTVHEMPETACKSFEIKNGQLPIAWSKAKNFNIYDVAGNKFIDFTSTIFVANIGHSNKRLLSYLKLAIKNNLINSYAYIKKIREFYLRRLISFAGKNFHKAFLMPAGTKATEAALKLMRMNGQNLIIEGGRCRSVW
jgi:CMP-N-acetylneuraminic acid synthetase